MYHQFFGLSEDPFKLTSDPSFLFLTAAHRQVLAGVTYAILNRKGFVVLSGDMGTGKTTLLNRIFQSIPAPRARFSVVLNPTLTPAEFLELMLLDFGFSEVPSSKAQRLIMLKQFLVEAFRNNQVSALVVDEAHKLQPDVLEEIRLLGNIELPEAKLLQVVLAGQTELASVLNRHDLRQLKQRIAVRLAVHPLSPNDVAHYIHYRWQKAGATKAHPFESGAVARIVLCSGGVPRLVNVLCDNALRSAYGAGKETIGPSQIIEVAKNLDLRLDVPKLPVEALRPCASLQRRPPVAVNGDGKVATEATSAPRSVGVLIDSEDSAVKPSGLKRLVAKFGVSPWSAHRNDWIPRIDS